MRKKIYRGKFLSADNLLESEFEEEKLVFATGRKGKTIFIQKKVVTIKIIIVVFVFLIGKKC